MKRNLALTVATVFALVLGFQFFANAAPPNVSIPIMDEGTQNSTVSTDGINCVGLGISCGVEGRTATITVHAADGGMAASPPIYGTGSAASPIAMSPASSTDAGYVSTEAQTFAGDKTFSGQVNAAGISNSTGSYLSSATTAGSTLLSARTAASTSAVSASSEVGTTVTLDANDLVLGVLAGASYVATVDKEGDMVITGNLDLPATGSGSCTLNGASPSVCTATIVIGQRCTCSPVGTTAAIAGNGCAVDEAASTDTTLTITGPNSAAYAVVYSCFF
jgi:hypothetical protein